MNYVTLPKAKPSTTVESVGNGLFLLNLVAAGVMTIYNYIRSEDSQDANTGRAPSDKPRVITVQSGNPPGQVMLPPTPVSVSELGKSSEVGEVLSTIKQWIEESKSTNKRKRTRDEDQVLDESDSDDSESDSDTDSTSAETQKTEKRLMKSWKSTPMELTAFSGETMDWASWKMDAEIVLYGTGFKRVMTSSSYSRKHKDLNSFLFTVLYKALRAGSAKHLCIKRVRTQDGYKLWRRLLQEYEGDPTIVAGAADRLTEQLRNCIMVNGMTASRYISKFSTF